MKKLFISSAILLMLSAFAVAQEKKGVDTQNKEIREQNDVTTKTTRRDQDV